MQALHFVLFVLATFAAVKLNLSGVKLYALVAVAAFLGWCVLCNIINGILRR